MTDRSMGIIELVFSFGLVLGLIALDLWFLHREQKRDRLRQQAALEAQDQSASPASPQLPGGQGDAKVR